jgi:predicted RND superfamily exporter protein
METTRKTRDHILASFIIIFAGVLSLVICLIKGYFGLAVQAFIGLLACSSALIFIMPLYLKGNER